MSLFPFVNSPPSTDLEKWFRMDDIQRKDLAASTWIPLRICKSRCFHGQHGQLGHRQEYCSIESVIVPSHLHGGYESCDWHSIGSNTPERPWVKEDGQFIPPGCHDENPEVRYPVVQLCFETGETTEWDLFQEIVTSLRLLRKGDVWICPEEDDAEVVQLERKDGEPECMLMKAEFLRDYLCARGASLLITAFSFRTATEQNEEDLPIEEVSKTTDRGQWDGIKSPIHEGGRPYGMSTAVIRTWRESVDPTDDVPIMPHPTEEPEPRSESYTRTHDGKKLWTATGRIWSKYWLRPAEKSPRVKGDRVASRVPFLVENQEGKTIAGEELAEYRGWLWFKSAVIPSLFSKPRSEFQWYSHDTGEIGPRRHQTLHFGINDIGLINVLGYDLGRLPEWVQKLWVTHNVAPEGGLSKELHLAHNLGRAPTSSSPETVLWNNFNRLDVRIEKFYGAPLFSQLPEENEFFKKIHRFHGASLEDVCKLAKEIHRLVSEKIDLNALNRTLDPGGEKEGKEKNLRQIRRLDLWLTRLGADGREMTKALSGVNDLRQGDAHAAGSKLRQSLGLFDIDPESVDYGSICSIMIRNVGSAFRKIGMFLEAKAQETLKTQEDFEIQ
jgi:hypothetical protein